jgi:hypothetical protein
VVTQLFNSRCTSGHPEHPFTSLSHPPVTVVGRRRSLPLLVFAAAQRRRRPSERKAPVANLCNRLVVNEHLPDRANPERKALAVPTTASGPATDGTHPRTRFGNNTLFDGVE